MVAVITEEAGDAATSAKTAYDVAHKARGEVDALAKKADDLLNKYVEAEAQLETESKTRQDLERSVAPRKPLAVIIDRGKSNLEELQTFAGIHPIHALIMYVPEFGAERAANQIATIVHEAGWTYSFQLNADLPDGMVVRRHASTNLGAINDPDEVRSEGAATALVAFLGSFDWEATVDRGSRSDKTPFHVPANTVRVEIGVKAMPYFDPEWQKELDKTMKEMRKIQRNQPLPMLPQ